MEEIYIKIDEKEFGPITLDELADLVREGSFSREDLVWYEDMSEWQPAKNLLRLQPILGSNNGRNGHHPAKIYAVASGKGGVGKTVLTSSLGVGLASVGSNVILVDGDLGGANLHTCMGVMQPEYTFFDFYTLQKDTLDDIVLDTPVDNLRMISGACGTLGVANPKYFQKQRFIRGLKNLNTDNVILDLGAGSTYDTIDFFLLADEKLLVMTPEPTSVHEAFGFIKVCLMRQLNRSLKDYSDAREILAKNETNQRGKMQITIGDLLKETAKSNLEAAKVFRNVLDSFKPKLILNMVKTAEDLKEVMAIQAAALELLSLQIENLGYISYDPNVSEAVKSLKPFLLYNPKSKASQDLAAVIRVNLLGKKGFKEIIEKRRWRRKVENYSKEFPEKDFLVSAPICSFNCFYWGDCDYQDGGNPCRVRHLEPVLRDFNQRDENGYKPQILGEAHFN